MLKSRFHWTMQGNFVGSTWIEHVNLEYLVRKQVTQGGAYLAGLAVDARKIDLGHKGDIRRNIWVALSAVDLQAVDAVFVYALFHRQKNSSINARQAAYVWGAQDCPVPVRHQEVIVTLKTVGASLCSVMSDCVEQRICDGLLTRAEALLALLELFQQSEIARDLCTHFVD